MATFAPYFKRTRKAKSEKKGETGLRKYFLLFHLVPLPFWKMDEKTQEEIGENANIIPEQYDNPKGKI